MSMNSKNLSVLAYSNGFTLWHYKTEDLNYYSSKTLAELNITNNAQINVTPKNLVLGKEIKYGNF